MTHIRAKINWLAECLLRASHLDQGKGQDAKRNAADRNKSDDPIGPIPRSSLGVLRKLCGEAPEHGNLARKPVEVPRNEHDPLDNTKSRQNLSWKTAVAEVLRKYWRKPAETPVWYKRIM